VLNLTDLSKNYADVAALAECSFDVNRGQLLGFLGPNGAGKTTAMRSIFGLVRPDRGTVTWDGAPVDPAQRLRFGYMPESRGLYPRMKIADQVGYFGRLHGMSGFDADAQTAAWLERLGLADRAESRLEELSHGNQQRVQLATALVHNPELLVLDEPFSGLDPRGVKSMADILAERAADGAAVVFSSHQLDLVEDLCEEVVIINEGHIVLDGPVAELRSRSPKRYLEVEVSGGGTGWAATFPLDSVLERNGDLIRAIVDRDIDLAQVVGSASAAGAVTHFSFEPPNLSEVFLEAIEV
jgi:ABC-2 type transport system ATP-binding protein